MKIAAILVSLFTLICLTLGLLLVFWGLNGFNEIEEFKKYSHSTMATVVAQTLRTAQDEEGREHTYYYPVVKFTTLTGQRVEATSTTSTSQPARIGEQIPIYYLTNQPNRIYLAPPTTPSNTLSAGLPAALGGAFILASLFLGITGWSLFFREALPWHKSYLLRATRREPVRRRF